MLWFNLNCYQKDHFGGLFLIKEISLMQIATIIR